MAADALDDAPHASDLGTEATEHDQFAHPAAAYVITPAGRIARVLSGLGLDGNDLRLALVDAGEGRIGTFIDHIRLLCYGFDPAQGIYTASIERWLMALAAATVIAFAGEATAFTTGASATAPSMVVRQIVEPTPNTRP